MEGVLRRQVYDAWLKEKHQGHQCRSVPDGE